MKKKIFSVFLFYFFGLLANPSSPDIKAGNVTFSNLINNAIQSIPDNRRGEIAISLEITNKKVLIKIADNGSGIPKEIGDKLFEPNFTTKTSGMGLGLAIVKNIMEDAGGRIWYETEIGKGSAFLVEMPLYLPGNNTAVSD